MADKDLTVHLKADDKITPAAKKAADALKKLEKPVEVEIDADISGVLGAFDQVAAEARATAEAAEVLGRALGPELAAKADPTAIVGDLKQMGLTLDQIKGNADELGAKLKELSDADVGGKLGANLGTARGKIDEMSDSARGANSAMANMIGNTTQDLGALGGLAGSAGVAIGQLGEYAADAALGGEKLSSSLLSMAKVAGPMAAIGIATAVVAKEMARAAASKAFNAAQLKAFTDSVEDTGSVLKAINDQLEDTGQLVFKIAGGFDAIDVGGDIAPMLGTLNLSTAEFLRLVNSGEASWTRFMDGLKAAGVAEQDLINIQVAHGRILADQATATEVAALTTELLADKTTEATQAWKDSEKAVDAEREAKLRNADATSTANVKHQALVDTLEQERRKTENLGRQFDTLRGQLDMDAAIGDFQVAFVTATAKVQEGVALTGDEIIGLKNHILNVAEFAKLNPVQVKALLQAIDDGNIAGVLRLAQNEIDQQKLRVKLEAYWAAGTRIPAPPGQGSGFPVGRAAPPATAGVAATATTTVPVPVGYSTPTIPVVIKVQAPAPTINVNAGVVGNRFDVDRTVTKALRRHQRLNGQRP